MSPTLHPTVRELSTPWQVDTPIPLPEYPRPQLVREAWQNLNGLWDYAILPIGSAYPQDWQGQILVPFAPEAKLSGVGRVLQPNEVLYYRRSFSYPLESGQKLLLHFGAVDYSCRVWVNEILVGEHVGGYLPFSFEIQDALQAGENTLTLAVLDPSDAGLQQHGKQRLEPGGIWYASVSGIWQTVWLEPVPEAFIQNLKLTPDLDSASLIAEVRLNELVLTKELSLRMSVSFAGKPLGQVCAKAGEPLHLAIPELHLWGPGHPHLYDLHLELLDGESVLDSVDSYFAMRKFGKMKDKDGYWRMTLNDEPIFLYGPLDQGYFPDGLYTAPSEEAMLYDIQYTQKIACNMIRKHIKVEPARWYYACDRMGMIVWQDMPNGGRTTKDAIVMLTFTSGIHRYDQRRLQRFGRQDEANRQEFETELEGMIEALYHFPCIAVWVPFNESWGQFHALRIADKVKTQDPTRLVDHASGWFDQGGGDFQSRHVYFKPLSARLPDHRVLAVTEFGGYALKVPGHLWDENKKFGYRIYRNSEDLTKAYLNLLEKQVKPLIPKGLCVAIYTQTTDVEVEVNGYLSYDRQVEKMDTNLMREAHLSLIELLGSGTKDTLK